MENGAAAEIPGQGAAKAIIVVETPLLTRSRERSSKEVLRLVSDPSTGLPVIPGSSVTGALKRVSGCLPGSQWNEHARFADAALLFFPLRSTVAPVIWATSPRALSEAGVTAANWDGEGNGKLLVSARELLNGETLPLEEYAFAARFSERLFSEIARIAEAVLPQTDEYAFLRKVLPANAALLPDDLFNEIVPQNLIFAPHLPGGDDSATFGRFLYREYVPSDSIFVAVGQGAIGRPDSSRIQIGSDESRGRGVCAIRILPSEGG